MRDGFRLALVRFVYSEFGYEVPDEEDSEGPFQEIAESFKKEGTKTYAGQSDWFKAAKKTFDSNELKFDFEDIKTYDLNIDSHLGDINHNREEDISLRYYQYLSLLFTEYILDRSSKDREKLVEEFKTFVNNEYSQSEDTILGQISANPEDEFRKFAYWMATGSGKTFVLHINFLQVLDYFGENTFSNAILIAPDSTVADQHRDELEDSHITTASLHESTSGMEKVIRITDIHTLSGETVDIGEFNGDNVIFVDEGHKGRSSDASKSGWIHIRDSLTKDDGLAFEYSATFASSLSDKKNSNGHQEYARAIIFDYPYGRFHKDGYGKDYNIVNIDPKNGDIGDKYLLANVLSYYEKLRIHRDNKDNLVEDYNLEKPLSIFIGHTVNSKNGTGSGMSDIGTIINHLSSVIQNKNGWVTTTIKEVINEEGRFGEEGLFNDRFGYLRDLEYSSERLYSDMMNLVFNSENPTKLELRYLKNVEDKEIALSTDTTDKNFGVINIGDTKEFFDRISDSDSEKIQATEDETNNRSLFKNIDNSGSDVNFLLGARKFAEGWNTTRPSVMGLINIGQSKGPTVIQMFGRGVRVTGANKDGKRELDVSSGSGKFGQLKRLQTLDVFGVKASYIQRFKEHLESERLNFDENVQTVPVEISRDPPRSDLKVPEIEETFNQSDIPVFSLDDSFQQEKIDSVINKNTLRNLNISPIDFKPDIEVSSRGSKITPDDGGFTEETHKSDDGQTNIAKEFSLSMGSDSLGLDANILDWDAIWHKCVDYKQEKGYSELIVNKKAIKEIFGIRGNKPLGETKYHLISPADKVRVNSLEKSELRKVESLCVKIVSKYMDNVYSKMRAASVSEEFTVTNFDEDWITKHIPEKYDVDINDPEINEEFIRKLKKPDADLRENFFKEFNQVYTPVLVDAELMNVEEYKEKINSFSPEGIDNAGESKFLSSIENQIKDGILSDYEAIIMRNQARMGVSIPEIDGLSYPDFVVWATKNGKQHIILSDPHGMRLAGKQSELETLDIINKNPFDDSEYDIEVEVHACVFARTKTEGFNKDRQGLKQSFNINSTLEDSHIFLIDDTVSGLGKTEEQVEKMLSKYLE